MNIILIGMPGCGKTHYGKLAAQQLNRTFIDTDDLVEKEYSKRHQSHATCREIVHKHGNSYFYNLEKEVIKDLISAKKVVIATGGGSLTCPENIPILKNLGWMLYIKTTKNILLQRIMKKEHLPSYLEKDHVEDSFDRLLKMRLPLYEHNCHQCIDTNTDDVLEIISLYASKKENIHGK